MSSIFEEVLLAIIYENMQVSSRETQSEECASEGALKKRRRCYRTPHTEPRLQIDIFPKNIHQCAYSEAVTNLISKQYPSINTLYSTPTPEHHNYADSLHLTATLPIAPTIILLLLALHCSRPDPTRLLRSTHQRR